MSSDYFRQAIQQKSAQQSEQTELAPEKIAELQRKITQIEAHIQAIETKKAYVLSDPAELEKQQLQVGLIQWNRLSKNFFQENKIC